MINVMGGQVKAAQRAQRLRVRTRSVIVGHVALIVSPPQCRERTFG